MPYSWLQNWNIGWSRKEIVVSDSQQAKAILEGAAATTQSWQLSNTQLREQAELEVQAAQARSNTEVREMAQKFEVIEQNRQQ